MCNGDVTPITFYDDVLLPERKLPMPDLIRWILVGDLSRSWSGIMRGRERCSGMRWGSILGAMMGID